MSKKIEENEEVIRFMGRSLEDTPTRPYTLSEENRSVQVVISSTTPVLEFDRSFDDVIPTVILPEGIETPRIGQVPLLDCHDRMSTESQIGSVRNMKAEGDEFVGDAFFASDDKSERVFSLVKDGHLTDYSISARILDGFILEEGETKTINNRSFTGPIKIVTKSSVSEVSSCPIGADSNAKNRSKKDGHKMAEAIEKKPETPAIVAPVVVDQEAVRSEAITAERSRVAEVESLCRGLKMDDKFISEVKALDVTEVKERALKVIAKQNEEIQVNTPHVTKVAEPLEKFRTAAGDALMMRVGKLDKDVSAERQAIAREVGSYSLLEICRTLLAKRNIQHDHSQHGIISRAISSSDFPILMGNIANKTLLQGFEESAETYTQWADTSGNIRDFKTQTRARAGELGGMQEIIEGEATPYAGRSEQSEEFNLRTFSEGFTLGRKAIINDDLGEMTDAFEEFGKDVRQLYGDLAYDELFANANMGDGNPLFDATHANLGTQGIISETTIGEAIRLMKLQKDIGGRRRLNIRGKYILSSVKNEGAVETFFKSDQFVTGSADATRTNIYAGQFTRIYEPRLDDNDSGDPWFMLGPDKTIQLSFLNGNQSPFMEQMKDFDTDGVKWRVRADVGAKAVKWEGMVRNLGA